MNRRDSLRALSALGLASAAPRALTQAKSSGATRRIGYLQLPPDPDSKVPGPQRAGSQALRKLGWIEGENLIFERAFADYQVESLAGLADELVRKGVEVLLTNGPEATLAAARATKTIPIVFVNVVWPVEQGVIDSFARPGRNATGISWSTGVEVSNKRLEFLREIAPAARRLSWLLSADYSETLSGGRFDMSSVMGAAAQGLGFETRFHDVRKLADVETALAEVTDWRAQALMAAGTHVNAERRRIAEFAMRQRLPSAGPDPVLVESGFLLYYGQSPSEIPLLLARYFEMVDRILRGAKPAEIPVYRPSKYDLVVNMKTAKALGLKIPQSVLLRAERVIE
jgi:putative ABC transport system substrate-binding protein